MHENVICCLIFFINRHGILSIGEVNTSAGSAAQSFSYDGFVPSNAQEVLFYVVVQVGRNSGRDEEVDVELETTEGATSYTKYLRVYLYNQEAWSLNSENMWFPATASRSISVKYPGRSFTGNGSIRIHVIGYWE